ncbi:MAG TPA: methylmalonyl Co-A mutase-associated GTPase MeaB [Candidatus Elarobacter sp.]|jgi:LAO/AO transport system kinase
MDAPAPTTGLLEAFRAGDPRALARAISRCESGRGAELIRALYPSTGRALTVGLTGPPGVGKSTLSGALISHVRKLGKTVGVISVDPSSPFSHGALLGDRIRLSEHFTDPDVFIRSMASRGHLGGLSGATADAVSLMDAFGKDVVLIETVGVGQSEIEIAEVADTTLVALQPGSGDSVQVLKAGVLEIADVFVVNKSDHPMALQLQREIRSMMEMLSFSGWVPKLVGTQALEGKGVDKLWDAIVAHDAWLRKSGAIAAKRREAFAHRVRQLALGTLESRVASVIDEIGDDVDPYAAAAMVLERFGVPDGVHAHGHLRPHGDVRAHVKGL